MNRVQITLRQESDVLRRQRIDRVLIRYAEECEDSRNLSRFISDLVGFLVDEYNMQADDPTYAAHLGTNLYMEAAHYMYDAERGGTRPVVPNPFIRRRTGDMQHAVEAAREAMQNFARPRNVLPTDTPGDGGLVGPTERRAVESYEGRALAETPTVTSNEEYQRAVVNIDISELETIFNANQLGLVDPSRFALPPRSVHNLHQISTSALSAYNDSVDSLAHAFSAIGKAATQQVANKGTLYHSPRKTNSKRKLRAYCTTVDNILLPLLIKCLKEHKVAHRVGVYSKPRGTEAYWTQHVADFTTKYQDRNNLQVIPSNPTKHFGGIGYTTSDTELVNRYISGARSEVDNDREFNIPVFIVAKKEVMESVIVMYASLVLKEARKDMVSRLSSSKKSARIRFLDKD